MSNGFSNPYIGLTGSTLSDPRQGMSDQMNQQQKKKPWWTSIISELGGTGGAVGGATGGAAIGSVVPGLGTVLGGLIGAGVGGFFGGTGGRVVENEVRDNRVGLGDALKEGAVNGVLSAGPGSLLKVAKGGKAALTGGADAFTASLAGKSPDELLKTSTRGKIFNMGNQLLASQYGTISKPVARQTDPLNTISKLADYGVTKPQDAERISQAFTGGHGMVTQAVADAVGQSKSVDLSGLEKTVDTALANHGVVGNSAKSVKSFVMGQLGRVEDPSAVDPSTALSMLRDIESHSAERLGKGNTYHMATTDDVLASKALRDTREHITDTLYTTAGANKNVASVLTPEFRSQLVALQPKNPKWQQFVDSQVMKSKSVADLRSTMAPFVKISKIIDEGDTNALTFGGRAGNAIGGGGSVGNKLLTGTLNLVKPATSQMGGKALRASATAGLDPLEAPTLRNIGSRMAVVKGPNALLASKSGVPSGQDPSALLNSGASNLVNNSDPAAVAQDPSSLLASANGSPSQTAPGGDATSSLLTGLNGGGDATSQLLGQPQQASQGGPSLASLQQAVQEDMQNNGGKGINQLMQLGQLYGIVDSSGNPVNSSSQNGLPNNIGKVTAQEYANAKAGAESVTQIAQALQANPNLLNKSAIPGGGLPIVGGFIKNATGTGQLDAIAYNAADKYLKLTTGATATDAEIKNTANRLMPRAGDSDQTVQTKLQQLQQYYNIYLQGAQ